MFVFALVPISAQAETTRQLDVPPGNLADALIVLAQQADISVAVNDPGLRAVRVAGLRGRYSIRRALRLLLRGSGFTFVMVDKSSIRLVRQRPKGTSRSALRTDREPDRVPASPDAEVPKPEIVVTATKQGLGLSSYPASIAVVEFEAHETARLGSRGIDMILQQMPNLASTNLGSGRNKIFIRGVADSSFNGVSQATISQYLGDNRLIYSAPDPDLALFDVKRIEVLEGPQGTLYGAGTLGGIIRIVPSEPDMQTFGASISGGIETIRHGSSGGDAVGTANLPILSDRIALRLLGYRTVSPGYVDDQLRRLSDVNRKSVTGYRATLRVTPAADWTVDLGGILQKNRSRDAQYSERGLVPLTRRSTIDQPYDNDYKMAFLRVEKHWDDFELISASSYTDHSIDSNFDASTLPGQSETRAYNEDMTVELLAQETRLSGSLGGDGRWVLGGSLVRNVNLVERSIGPPEDLETIAQIRNATLDTALFGEATFTVRHSLSLTLGGRLAYVRQNVSFAGRSESEEFEPRRSHLRLLPTLATSWKPRRGMLVYVRYQEGFRPGGLQVASAGNAFSVESFDADRIETLELGVRFGTAGNARLSGALSVSHSHWTDIQADLVDVQGLPFAANIGSGRIRNVAANLALRWSEELTVEGAAFINDSSLVQPAPLYASAEDRDLPNVADYGWRISARFDREFGPALLTVDGTIRYVGDSTLAVGAPFDLPQGDYYEILAGARLGFGRLGLSIDVQNLLDSRGNRFAYGNPFSVARGRQITPLRPRSIRVGFDFEF